MFADTGRDEDSVAVLQLSSSPVLALLLTFGAGDLVDLAGEE